MEDKKIYRAIISVMKEVEPIAKGRTNTQQNYKFRGVDELMNEISPLLSKHGIFPTTQAVENVLYEAVISKSGGGGTHLIRRFTFRFFADDGSYVDTTTDGEAIDYGDKASNKAQSVAYREAMFKMFVIPFQGEDIENESHELRPVAKAPAKPASVLTAQAQKAQRDEVRALVNEKRKGEGLEPITTVKQYGDYLFELYTLNLSDEKDMPKILAKLKE